MNKWNLVLIGLLLFSLTRLSSQEYYMSKPIGYGRSATGGGNASPTTVTTYNELKSALTASGSGVILIKGAIRVDYLSVRVKNKTILGLPGSKLYTNDQTSGKSGILYFKPGTNNVIMRNVTFVGPGAYDSDGRDCLTFDGATKCWVDHCDFQDGMDGNFDNKGNTDNITISWCKFSYNKAPKCCGSGGTDDHRFSNLVGSSSSNYPSDKQYSITWQYCWWAEGCVERQVRARNAQLHMLNCFWNSSVAKKCIGLEDGSNGKGTQCYIEGGVFDTPSSTKNIDVSYGGSPDVTIKDCIGNNLSNNSSTVSKPSYSYRALSSSKVKAAVTSSCGAGATLNVSASGAISSSCSGSSSGGSITLSASGGSGKINLSWSSSNISSGYQVYRDTDSKPSGRVRIGTTSSKKYTDNNVSSGTTYYYWIKATDSNGSTINSNAAKATTSGLKSSEVSLTLSETKNISALNVFPNPFSTSASFSFKLSSAQKISIRIYNLTGKIVDEIGEASYNSGENTVAYDNPGLKPGFYILSIQNETTIKNQRFLINTCQGMGYTEKK
jgi:pectate lyase